MLYGAYSNTCDMVHIHMIHIQVRCRVKAKVKKSISKIDFHRNYSKKKKSYYFRKISDNSDFGRINIQTEKNLKFLGVNVMESHPGPGILFLFSSNGSTAFT